MKLNMNSGTGAAGRSILSQLCLLVPVLFLIACGKSGGTDSGSTAGSGDGIVDVPPNVESENLDGTWNPKSSSSNQYYWCSQSGNMASCAASSTPIACSSAGANIGGFSVLGGGFTLTGGVIQLSSFIGSIDTDNEQTSASIGGLTWNIEIESDDEIYLSYGAGCIIIMQR